MAPTGLTADPAVLIRSDAPRSELPLDVAAIDLPLSIGQERILRLAVLNPSVPLYNMAASYRLSGALDVPMLRRAIQQIERDQAVLRTTFSLNAPDVVRARCAPHGDPSTFALIDAAQFSATEREHLLRIASGEVFDLSNGPLWRVTLIRIDGSNHLLVLTMHHSITDGWSYALFARELSRLYSALVAGEDPVPTPPPLSYAEFAVRQRDFLASEACDRQHAYWQARFAATPPPLALPGRLTGGVFGNRVADSVELAFPSALSGALAAYSQQVQATLFMTLLAGFAALLRNATGQEDMLLCTPVSGRHRAQAKNVIGYFNNILPIKLDLGGDPSFDELVQRCRATALDAYRAQDVPFQGIADLPQLRNAPLSRLLFSFDMPWPPALALDGIIAAPCSVDTGAADFELAVSLWLRDGRIFGSLRFRKSLFAPEAVVALGQGYVQLLTALVANPTAAVSGPAAQIVTAHLLMTPPARENAGAAAPFVAPRWSLEMQIAREWEETFDTRPIGIFDTLQSLGASSLAVVALAERIRRVFETELTIDSIFRAATIFDMALLLQADPASRTASPLAPIQPQGSKPPLFLCEGVGIYYPLAKYLGEDQPIYGLVTQASSDFPTVEALAARYVDAILETQPAGPFNIGGISFGGLVALEVAQQLRALGHEVALLALLDTPGPSAFTPSPVARRWIGHARNLIRYGRAYAFAKVRRGTTRNAQAHSEQSVDPLDVRRAFRASAVNYQVKPYHGAITLFMLAHRGAMTDSLFDPMLGTIDPYLGWKPFAEGGLRRHLLAGEHTTILREPFVERLGSLLRAALHQSSASAEAPRV